MKVEKKLQWDPCLFIGGSKADDKEGYLGNTRGGAALLLKII